MRTPQVSMAGIDQSHILGSGDTNKRQQARSVPLQKDMSSPRDSVPLRMSEQGCESTFMRDSADVAGNLGGCVQFPNCRHSCEPKISYRNSSYFHGRVPLYDGHAEGVPRAVNCGQASVPFCSVSRGASHSACTCGGQRHGPERCEESEVRAEENRFYHRGASVADAQVGHGHSRVVCECGRCCLRRPNTHAVRDQGYGFEDRVRGARGSPCFPPSEDSTYRVAPIGFMSKSSRMSRKATTIASRTDSSSAVNLLVHTQASKDQVTFYGWFLKRPTVSNTAASSSLPQVAIGGYKTPGLLESDYCESGPIVQRLERWRLRASDGMEVALMGMTNVAKSVENGFPIALAQCFMIGFPSAWIYMISNYCTVASKSSTCDLPSSSGSPNNADTQPPDAKNNRNDVPPTTLSVEADPVHIILSSPLFGLPEHTGGRSLHRLSPKKNESIQNGIVSDATSAPQPVKSREDLERNGNEDLQVTRNDGDACYGAVKPGNHTGSQVPVPTESRTTGCVLPEDGEHPAGLGPGHGLHDTCNADVLGEEPRRKSGVGILNGGQPRIGEQGIDLREFPGDDNLRAQEEEARSLACNKVDFNDDVTPEVRSAECTCVSDPDLKPTSASYTGEVGSDTERFSSRDSQDRESKSDVHVKDSPNEELSNKGDETAKQSALESEDASNTTRKRPFQELNLRDELDRRRKMIRETNSSLGDPKRSCPRQEMSEAVANRLPGGRPDAGLTYDSIPCTPLLESKKRPRDVTETPCVDRELRDEGVCDHNADKEFLDASHAQEVQMDELLVATAISEGLTMAEPKECKRPKISGGPPSPSGQFLVSGEESADVGVEPVTETCANVCQDEITEATGDSVIDKARGLKRLRKVRVMAVLCGQPKVSFGVLSEAEPDSTVDDWHGQSTVSAENCNLPVSATRQRQRMAETISFSSQSGKEPNSPPEEGETLPVTTSKESEAALRIDQYLEEVTKVEHKCKGRAKNQQPAPSSMYGRKPKPRKRYYKGTRRRRKCRVAEKGSSKPISNPDCKTNGGEKHPEDRDDDRSEKPEREDSAPVRQKHEHRVSERNSHGRDGQTSSDGQGEKAESDAQRDGDEGECATRLSKRRGNRAGNGPAEKAQSESKKDRKEGECMTRSLRRCRQAADGLSDPSCKLRWKGPAWVKRSKQGADESKPQERAGENAEMSDARDRQTSRDRPGEKADVKAVKDGEDGERVTRSWKRSVTSAVKFSRPSNKLLSEGRAGVKACSSPERRVMSRTSIVPPPPPPPRVADKTKTMVSEAFGLKTSRHGRVIVPRLATWLNQSIKYDMDGSIIGISEGFHGGEEEFGTGCNSFKLPLDKDAVSKRKKLQKAARLVG